MVNEGAGQTNQKISFKIVKLVNWVGFGIGIRHILAKCNYNFNCTNINIIRFKSGSWKLFTFDEWIYMVTL